MYDRFQHSFHDSDRYTGIQADDWGVGVGGEEITTAMPVGGLFSSSFFISR